jgi:hypothetical protein
MLWLALLCSGAAQAADSPGVDAVLVMDSSGSMKKTDPHRLRVPAAKLFISLLGEKDRVGVISFSDDGYPVIGLTPAHSKQDRARLFRAVDRISSKGSYTNLHAALGKAQEMLKRDGTAGRPQYIILMSDGKMDTGKAKQNTALVQKIRKDILPQMKKQGTLVYALAFTSKSDTALLREMAEQTQGMFRIARTDSELHPVFTTFFESAKQPDMLPINGGNFHIDNSIREVNIVASKGDAKTRISLEDPAGKRYNAKQAGPQMRWMATDRFDMISITTPKPGTWKLLSTTGQSQAYIVTDMTMDTDMKNGDLPAGSTPLVQAWLSREGQVLNQKDMLLNTKFQAEIVRPDGMVDKVTLLDNGEAGDKTAADGIHASQPDAYIPGSYEIRLIALNPTFDRKITRYFRLLPPAVASAPTPAAAETKPEIKKDTLPPDAAPVPDSKPEPAHDAAADKPKEDVREEDVSDEEAPAEDEQQPVPAQPKKAANEINIWVVLGIFTLINLVIGGSAVGVYLWMRKRKMRTGLTRFLEPSLDKLEETDAEEDGGADKP